MTPMPSMGDRVADVASPLNGQSTESTELQHRKLQLYFGTSWTQLDALASMLGLKKKKDMQVIKVFCDRERVLY